MKVYYTEDKFITIPFTVDVIDYEQYIDFKAKDTQYRLASTITTPFDEEFKQCEEEDKEIVKQKMLKYVEENVTLEDHTNIFNNSLNVLYDTLAIIYNEDELADIPPRDEQVIDKDFTYNVDTLFNSTITWITLYTHIVNLIDQYRPKPLKKKFSIDWNGKTYVINAQKAVDLLVDVAFTGGEVLTLLEFRRRRFKDIRATGDLDGNLEFSLGIHEMAILLREEGKELPINKAELVKYVDRQGNEFRKLPLSIVLTVRFFLIFIMKEYIITQTTRISSILLKGTQKESMKEKPLIMQKIEIKQYGKQSGMIQYTRLQLKENGLKVMEELITNQYF